MRSGWLLREGEVVCALEMTESVGERVRGLRGRSTCDGAVHLAGGWGLDTAAMRFELDLAFLSADLKVLRVARVRPWRVALPCRRAQSLLAAQAGSWERWGLRVGDQLVIREVQ
jgi:hypothetical protein